jgi:hypothetical protein
VNSQRNLSASLTQLNSAPVLNSSAARQNRLIEQLAVSVYKDKQTRRFDYPLDPFIAKSKAKQSNAKQ